MQERTRRPGRPAKLSRDAIVAGALQCDVRTLTMRDLAAHLGVSHSALYRWVSDREELLDLLGEVMVRRILPTTEPTPESWREWLADLAWRMHDEFVAVPGYATYVATPHRHNAEAFARLRNSVVRAFTVAGATPEMARQSWHVFALGITQWLGAEQADLDLGTEAPRFDLYLDVLLRGLPTRHSDSTD